MEISSQNLEKIQEFFNELFKNSSYELEVRLWGKNFSSNNLDYYKFENILHKLIFNKENGGMGLSDYTLETKLDILFDDEIEKFRLSINNDNDIKQFWLTSLLDGLDYSLIKKERINNIDMPEYNARISIASETEDEDKEESDLGRYVNGQMKKYYRLKNRYSIISADKQFRYDLTAIKSAWGISLRNSNVLKQTPSYEIEIEYIGGSKGDIKELSLSLLQNVWLLLGILQGNDIVLQQQEIDKVINGYNNLINIRSYHNRYNNSYSNEYKHSFIAANAVTLHRKNMISSNTVQNILNKYAVTLKADGQRNLLYIHKSDDETNGDFYLININFDIIKMGYKDTEWAATIIEGEYITDSNTFMCYDILFEKGEDIRRRQLNTTVKKKIKSRKIKTRMEYINEFYTSKTREKIGIYLNEVIKIELKKYYYSTLQNGSDIFEKAKTLWENRKNNSYESDGLIFIPILEYYPLKGGSWKSLFKWKPEDLNTIDFLIKTKKNSNGIDIRDPYIESDPEAKKLLQLQQFKTIELYVGGIKTIYDKERKKVVKKKCAVKFNPFNVEESKIPDYNTTRIILDSDEKMMAYDQILKVYTEVVNDTIVEFFYNPNEQEGFKWIPIRPRHDKTHSYKNNLDVYGNFDKTAYDVYLSIINPVTFQMISTGIIPKDEANALAPNSKQYFSSNDYNPKTRLPYQNFHNLYVKDRLLKQVAPSTLLNSKSPIGKLLDLGSGRGGDISRWKKYKFAEVVGIDVDAHNIDYSKNLYNNIPRPKPKVFYIRGDIGKLIFPAQQAASTESNKLRMKNYISVENYFDVVSVQFALHYFFENEIKLRTLIQNISDNLKIGGFLIGACFSGEKVFNKLKKHKEIEGTLDDSVIWRIKRIYKARTYPLSKPNYGREIEVFIKSIGNVHTEYLVNFRYLDEILKEYGIEKVLVNSFEDEFKNLVNSNQNGNEKNISEKISEEEKEFSFLNNVFIYKKVKNAPDHLYNKLVKMLERQDTKEYKSKIKVENDKDVAIVSENTEVLIENNEDGTINESTDVLKESDMDNHLNIKPHVKSI